MLHAGVGRDDQLLVAVAGALRGRIVKLLKLGDQLGTLSRAVVQYDDVAVLEAVDPVAGLLGFGEQASSEPGRVVGAGAGRIAAELERGARVGVGIAFVRRE